MDDKEGDERMMGADYDKAVISQDQGQGLRKMNDR